MFGFTWRALAFVLIAGHAAAQTTWYVSKDATAPFEGTLTQPFEEISQAIADPDTLAGDTLLVLPGVYGAFSTLSTKPLTIRSTDGPLVTVIAPGASDDTVRLRGFSSVGTNTFEGFTVWAKPTGTGVHVDRKAILRRCILLGLGVGSTGLFTDNCNVTNSVIEHCWISGFSFAASAGDHGGCEADFYNSILFANSPASLNFLPGQFNFCRFSDPHVVDFAGHDFHLLAGSPCIDAGDPNSPLDPDGTRADIGPLPYDPSYQPHTTYCTAKVNSLGCTPSIQALNTASISSPRPFWISCTNQISQRSGLMSYGFAPQAIPYQGGFKCVASPTRRSGVLNSGGSLGTPDCSGVFTLDFNETIRAGLDPALALGEEVFCQFWARDPAASFASNRSNAIRFKLAP
jgi:hypothetical protein